MKLVAGLGNPGPRYAGSRHNVGFMVVDELARRWAVSVDKYDRDFEAVRAECQAYGERVLLLKPQTYMNLSGRSILAAQQFYKLDCSDLLIVCDDLDLPVGRIRLRAAGSGGGQKGLENILLRLASNDIPRLRIGIGKVHPSVTTEYVLSEFGPDERELIAETLATAADAVECWLEKGIDAAMRQFNPQRSSPTDGLSEPPTENGSEGESP